MNNVSMRNKWGVFLVILAVTICYQLLLAHSLTPLDSFEGDDSLVFKQMGLAMLQGKVPYVDLFDHKGPIIYFINAFCQWLISGKWGLFLFFCLNIAAVTYVWWLIASLFIKSWGVVWPIAVALCSYMVVLSDGNLSEEWSLLPISYCLYVFVRHFVEGRDITAKAFFLIGLSLGLVTFIRINNAAAPCCAILVYTVYHLYKKTTVTPAKLLKSFLMMFVGWVAVVAACCLTIWGLYGNEGLEAMIYGTFTFNFEYMGAHEAVAMDRKRMYIFYGLTTLIILVLLLFKRKVTTMTVLIALCYMGSFVAIGSKGWGNYFIIFAPVTVVATACLYGVLNRWQKALVFLMFFLLIPLKFYQACLGLHQDDDFYQAADEIMQKIPQEEQQRIWNSGNFCALSVLHRNGLTQANSVMIYFQLLISERLMASEKARFESNPPAWIMTSVPFEEAVPLALDSVRVTHDYALDAVVGENVWRRVYFYKQINR